MSVVLSHHIYSKTIPLCFLLNINLSHSGVNWKRTRVEASMKKLLKRRLAVFPALWVALPLLVKVKLGKRRVGNNPLKLPPPSLLRPQVDAPIFSLLHNMIQIAFRFTGQTEMGKLNVWWEKVFYALLFQYKWCACGRGRSPNYTSSCQMLEARVQA